MHEKPNWSASESGYAGAFAEEEGEEHQVVVVNPDDIALRPHALDSLCKPLINSDILLKRCAFEEEFSFGRVGDCIMKTRPEDLMTKLIITTLKLRIRDPNR